MPKNSSKEEMVEIALLIPKSKLAAIIAEVAGSGGSASTSSLKKMDFRITPFL